MDEMKRAALADLEKRANDLMRGYIIELTGRIIDKTPVDTGRARSNWNVSVNKPDTNSFDVGDKDASAYAQHESKKELENARNAGQTNFWRGQVGWIANGLPYVPLLETGTWGVQAPQGMVRVSIEGMRPWLDKEAAKRGFR